MLPSRVEVEVLFPRLLPTLQGPAETLPLPPDFFRHADGHSPLIPSTDIDQEETNERTRGVNDCVLLPRILAHMSPSTPS